jgi:hypothetical protein
MNADDSFEVNVLEIQMVLMQHGADVMRLTSLNIAASVLLRRRDARPVCVSDPVLAFMIADAVNRFRAQPAEYLAAMIEATRRLLRERGALLVGPLSFDVEHAAAGSETIH